MADEQPPTHMNVQLRVHYQWDIRTGKVVIYDLGKMGMMATRDGVQFNLITVPLPEAAVVAMKALIDRMTIHHRHLASFRVGEEQVVLNEMEVSERLEAFQAEPRKMINHSVTPRPALVMPPGGDTIQ